MPNRLWTGLVATGALALAAAWPGSAGAAGTDSQTLTLYCDSGVVILDVSSGAQAGEWFRQTDVLTDTTTGRTLRFTSIYRWVPWPDGSPGGYLAGPAILDNGELPGEGIYYLVGDATLAYFEGGYTGATSANHTINVCERFGNPVG